MMSGAKRIISYFHESEILPPTSRETHKKKAQRYRAFSLAEENPDASSLSTSVYKLDKRYLMTI